MGNINKNRTRAARPQRLDPVLRKIARAAIEEAARRLGRPSLGTTPVDRKGVLTDSERRSEAPRD